MVQWATGGRSAHTTYGGEEEGVGGSPAPPLGEREQLRRWWIPSLADGDSVKTPSLPGGRILPAL